MLKRTKRIKFPQHDSLIQKQLHAYSRKVKCYKYHACSGIWKKQEQQTRVKSIVPALPYSDPNKAHTNTKQDRHCTYNITLRRVRATVVIMEKQCVLTIWVCVCSPRRMRQTVICGLTHPTFFHIISQKARFAKKNITEHKMCVLILPTTFVRNISYSKKKWARCDKKCPLVLK